MNDNENGADLGAALVFLRTIRGWTQSELSTASGVPANAISDYELGKKVPTPAKLDRIAAGLRLPAGLFDFVVSYTRSLRALLEREIDSFGQQSLADIERSAAELGEKIGGLFQETMKVTLARLLTFDPYGESAPPAEPSEEDRPEARRLWDRLEPLAHAERRVCLQELREYKSWALCELLCAESAAAAEAGSGGAAVELAELAHLVAGLVPGEASWRARLAGYALAHLAGARRAAGDLAGAEEALALSAKAWPAGVSDLFRGCVKSYTKTRKSSSGGAP